jgi:transcriptional regulator GlxA family with amidase domain
LAQVSIRRLRHADIVIVPSCGLDLDSQLARHGALLPWLRKQAAQGAHIAGICTGVAYLAEAGLLDGRQATTHWAMAETFRQRYPKVDWHPDAFITDDRRMLCSGGVYASMDLSLYLVEKFCGHEVALQCAKALLINMPRTSQAGYAVLPLARPHNDAKVRTAEAHLQKNYARGISFEVLAQDLGMSPRNATSPAASKAPRGGCRVATCRPCASPSPRKCSRAAPARCRSSAPPSATTMRHTFAACSSAPPA